MLCWLVAAVYLILWEDPLVRETVRQVLGSMAYLGMIFLLSVAIFGIAISVNVDPDGYIFFCLCMGRLGNQVEHFLGGLRFAMHLNRTLVLPPFRSYNPNANIPFTKWFALEPLARVHKVIPAEEFMRNIAPLVWPPEARAGFCYQIPGYEECVVKEGNPFEPFWTELGVDFVDHVRHSVSYRDIEAWSRSFPPSTYPVIAMKGAPASFPMHEGDEILQSYLVFSDELERRAMDVIRDKLGGVDGDGRGGGSTPGGTAGYLGMHLRNGVDWVSVCNLIDGTRSSLMASYQCLGHDSAPHSLTQEMCLPTAETVVQTVKRTLDQYGGLLRYVYIATDHDPMVEELRKALPGVHFVYLRDTEPILDVVLLAKSRIFIGNCVSSFSSFVWRQRKFHNLGPSEHFGNDKKLTLQKNDEL